jgi:hypothetical protein
MLNQPEQQRAGQHPMGHQQQQGKSPHLVRKQHL